MDVNILRTSLMINTAKMIEVFKRTTVTTDQLPVIRKTDMTNISPKTKKRATTPIGYNQ